MIKQKLEKLIDVKSIITLSLTIAFIILAVTNKITTEFLSVYTTIIAFYFGTQYAKKGEKADGE